MGLDSQCSQMIAPIQRCTSCYTPDIRSMWGCNVFAFLFVSSFVRSYVRSFIFPSQGQSFCVNVYKTLYFEDPLMDFIHIWHDGKYRSKVFISTIPIPGVTLGSRSRTNFRWLSWMRRPTETRRSRVQPPPRSATFFRGD